jgi:K+/H+ antiporter YhaU regulatory subunit KhtT
MFYGKWEVVDFITGNKDQYGDIMGAIIEYDESSFVVNGKAYAPEYKISIIPITENPQYYFSDGSHPYKRMSIQDLDIGEKYFVVVRAIIRDLNSVLIEPGCLLFIKDDDTLVIAYHTVLAVAKRLEHYPTDYSIYYHPI